MGATVVRGEPLNSQPSPTPPTDTPTLTLRPGMQLMDLPAEIRDRIFRFVLPVGRFIQFDRRVHIPQGSDGVRLSHKVQCLNQQDIFSEPSNRLALLRICKQAYREGRPILYWHNKWFANHVRPFEDFLLPFPNPGTGLADPGALFKDISLWITENSDVYPAMKFVCYNMPALRHFQMTVTYKELRNYQLKQHSIGDRLLKGAGQFTRCHPILRKVVWNKKSGRSQDSILIERFFRLEQIETITARQQS
ncbi:hypothetical protein H2200_008123 [Cladophialophora chaetospira]|uniref:2EXR domain-containing protein n=1 Tax=Cladophialophora chaetospira TaxID=386627 RepID=A0AA38X5A9_9EURO|nr:hypothetical protein H2200_008123 [Cladophialophora chaetospira]